LGKTGKKVRRKKKKGGKKGALPPLSGHKSDSRQMRNVKTMQKRKAPGGCRIKKGDNWREKNSEWSSKWKVEQGGTGGGRKEMGGGKRISGPVTGEH